MIGRRSGAAPAGQLSDSVKHVLVDEDAVPRLQNRMGLSYLEVQNTALCCGDLKVGVPVHRSRTVRQGGKFIAIKCYGKSQDIMRYLLLQLMIK